MTIPKQSAPSWQARGALQKQKHADSTCTDALDAILTRLDKVRRSGAGYVARCPAHEDRSPSLSLRETSDGRVLIHCHGGCQSTDVLAALGMGMSDLFPRDGRPRRSSPLPGVSRADLRALAVQEARILAIVALDKAKGRAISVSDQQRAMLARERLAKIGEVLA